VVLAGSRAKNIDDVEADAAKSAAPLNSDIFGPLREL